MKKAAVFFLSALTIFGAYAQEQAKETVTTEAAESMNQDMDSAENISSGMMMDEVLEKYREKRNLPPYGQPGKNGSCYFSGSYTVAVNSNTANFVKARSAAFRKAYIDAVAKIVLDRVGQEMTTTLRTESSDDSSDATTAPEKPADGATVLQKKIDAMNEAEIDRKLENLGVDPKSISEKGVDAKKDLYRSSLLTKVMRKAFASAAGCLTIQTFETRDAKGNYAIGVVLRSDAACTEIAKSISKKQRPVIQKMKGLTLEEALPTDKEMLTQFGVRLFFDETGTPTLLSFAQHGSSYTGTNPRRADRAMKQAMKQAENLANAQLTEFINSRIMVEEGSLTGEEEATQMIFNKDGSKTEEDITEYIDKQISSAKIEGSDSLKGRSTVYKKILKHPSGHNVAVVVRQWSFQTVDAVDAVLKGTTPQKKKTTAPTVQNEDSGVREGRTYDF